MQLIQWKPVAVCASMALSGLTILAFSDTTPSKVPATTASSTSTIPARTAPQVVPMEIAGVHNAFRLSPKVISGSQPEGEEAFKALKALGIKTIITVDGAHPNVKLAKKYGLRYVQIPFGYDGLPREQGIALARAVRELPGPIFVHCHHGKHRSPVAAACTMIANDGWSNDDALAFLKRAGTGANYTGLWASIREFQVPTAEELKKAPHKYSAIAPTPPLVQTMVKMDELADNLKSSQTAQWGAPASHPDLDAAHEALMLREIYAELLREKNIAKRPADFRAWLTAGESSGADLEAALRAHDSEKADAAYKNVLANCASCHAVYRNVPQKP